MIFSVGGLKLQIKYFYLLAILSILFTSSFFQELIYGSTFYDSEGNENISPSFLNGMDLYMKMLTAISIGLTLIMLFKLPPFL
ncbi:hypothetical protein, partial [Xanthovirga aplysinae]|uniref:hypothetical protein n=1 Tax=Xanthovirga aplysinae TaxID=2529853 RepID=UPI001CA38D18